MSAATVSNTRRCCASRTKPPGLPYAACPTFTPISRTPEKLMRGRVGDHAVVVVGIALHHRVAFAAARRAAGEIGFLGAAPVALWISASATSCVFFRCAEAEVEDRFVVGGEVRAPRIADVARVGAEGRVALRERRASPARTASAGAAHDHAAVAAAAHLQRAAVPAARQIHFEADIGRGVLEPP